MMRILHYHPQSSDDMIMQHIVILQQSMGIETRCDIANSLSSALQLLASKHYDILHIHGCWHNSMQRVAQKARRMSVRLVVTPHGQLEPWMVQQDYLKEKLPKQLLYQRDIIRNAYAVIVQGRMEQKCLEQLGWNRRIVIIRNCLITSSITPKQMATAISRLYRRIMDSDPLALMTIDTHQVLRFALKAGITGDSRWVGLLHDNGFTHNTYHDLQNKELSTEQWRLLKSYIQQEQITDVVERGLRLLGVDMPDVSLDSFEPFTPDNYESAISIDSAIGQQFATENDRLISTFRHLRRLIFRHRLALSHVVELDIELRQHPCEEDKLLEDLRFYHLYKTACRMMQLMSELTGLDEGFMPVPPLKDRMTRHLRYQVDHRLSLK